ncbi:MAG: ABC transporter ATP-binding protein [Clostridiales bacterium]|nr:ABC transporter ATP-binding protein [Clostridiales bacterium]
MKLIGKYLKPYIGVLLLSFLLLFGQAASELSLPNLMSDIVTTGIQYSGIEEKVPEAISEDGLNFLTSFMTQENKEVFLNAYAIIETGSDNAKDYIDEYPLLSEKNIYVRNKLSKDVVNQVADIYGKAVYSFIGLFQGKQNGNGDDNGMQPTAMDQDTTMDITTLYQISPMISMMPEGQLQAAIDAADQEDPSVYEMIAPGFTKSFYQELGVDMETMQHNYILRTGLLMLLVALGGVVAAIGVGFFASRTGAKVAKKLRRDVFEKVESFSSAEYDKFSTASLITRTTNDIQQVQMLVVMGIRMMCYAPIMGIGGIIFAVGTSVSLSWIIAAAVVVMLGLIMVIFSIALPKFKSLQKLIDRLNLVSRENLSGLMVIRAFGNETYEEGRFDTANKNLSKTNLFVQRTMAFMFPVMMFLMNCVTLAIVWFGSKAIANSNLQIGDMMAFMQYAMQIIMSFLMISMMFIMVPRASVSATRIREVLDTELVIKDKEKTVKLNDVKGVLEFHDVSFRYQNAESDVLEHLSFIAKPGETTAFIGSTGAGKSTLINLIPRFYDVTQGSITLDGVDIRDLNQKDLRDMIGYVPQKGMLFTGDIASNIRYGKENANLLEVNTAIEVAQAKEFVDSTDDGIETPIAQGGTNVSGGQKQRLSIARAIVKDAPIYIFDDSFSALDFKTDAALRHSLKEHTSNATVLIVAQRVSTIMKAEQIIVLDEGKIVGKGTHKELLSSCKEYREIAESQLSKEELA